MGPGIQIVREVLRMVRISQVLGVLILGVLLLGASHQAIAATSPAVGAPSVQNHHPTPSPAPDPFLGGDLTSKVPVATRCNDYHQCDNLVPGTPCDTPIGCICGYSGMKAVCARF